MNKHHRSWINVVLLLPIWSGDGLADPQANKLIPTFREGECIVEMRQIQSDERVDVLWIFGNIDSRNPILVEYLRRREEERDVLKKVPVEVLEMGVKAGDGVITILESTRDPAIPLMSRSFVVRDQWVILSKKIGQKPDLKVGKKVRLSAFIERLFGGGVPEGIPPGKPNGDRRFIENTIAPLRQAILEL